MFFFTHVFRNVVKKTRKPAAKKAEVPAAPKAAEPEKKGRGGVEIFADDFEDDEE